MRSRNLRVTGPFDLARTLAPLSRGPGDPTARIAPGVVARATRLSGEPVSLVIRQSGDRLDVDADGPGEDAALEAIDTILGGRHGLHEPAEPIRTGIHPLVDRLARLYPGIRIPRSGAVLEALVPAILEQKVTGLQARQAFIGLIRIHGEAAPGPAAWRLRLPPSAATYAALPYFAYHPFGVERRRADVIRRVAARADRFEATLAMSPDDARSRLMSVPGIGPWTAAEVAVRALGDEDAVSVGDFHLPHLVSFALTGEPRGSDERMLELLEPWRGQRARVVRLIELGGPRPPRRGPRLTIQPIADR